MLLILFVVIILYWYKLPQNDDGAMQKYLLRTSLLFFLLAGLRNKVIYNDTLIYVDRFNYLADMTMQQVIFEYPKDTFFYIVSQVLHPILFHNYTLWLLLISASFILPLYRLLKRYSVNYMLSWWCFAFIGIMMFVMAGLRQTVAMGLVITSFLYLINGKNIFFFVCIALAYLFHTTSLIFLIVYPLSRLKFTFNKTTIFFYIIVVTLIINSGSILLKETISLLSESDERFVEYRNNGSGSNYTYAFQQLVLVAPSLYLLRRRYAEPVVSIFSHLSVIALLCVMLSPVIAEMFRVSMYFSWSILVLFPMAMKEVERKSCLPQLYILFFIFYLVFINKTLTLEYYFWFDDTTDYIMRTR